MPSVAQADLFSMYVSGSNGYVSGQESPTTILTKRLAVVQKGLELLGVDIWGEKSPKWAKSSFCSPLTSDLTLFWKEVADEHRTLHWSDCVL